MSTSSPTSPRMPEEFDAGLTSSPFFPIAAKLMGAINAVLGTLTGWFGLPPGFEGASSWAFIAAHTVGAVALPVLIAWLLQALGKIKGRTEFGKVAFFVGMLLFPMLVIALTGNVADRLDQVRRQKRSEAAVLSASSPANAFQASLSCASPSFRASSGPASPGPS